MSPRKTPSERANIDARDSIKAARRLSSIRLHLIALVDAGHPIEKHTATVAADAGWSLGWEAGVKDATDGGAS